MARVGADDDSHLGQLAEQQAALRRVATLLAQGAPTEDVLALVAEQVAGLLRVPLVSIVRFEADGTASERAAFSARGALSGLGKRRPLEGTNVVAQVRRSGAPARIDDHRGLTGTIADAVSSTVGVPIAVAGRPWGAIVVASTEADGLPANAAARLADFTELVATAIANAEARGELQRLADEQAALRRVATLVASGTGPEQVFLAVAEEVWALLGCDTSGVVRFNADGTATMVGGHRTRRATGERFELHPDYVLASVRDTGQAARFDTDDPTAAGMPEPVRAEGISSGLASPIVVDGELWGAITVASLRRPLRSGTERRLADFTELVATAISNAQAREDLRRLAEEQAALRRAATSVAKEPSPVEVFAKVVEEAANAVGDVDCILGRLESDGTVTTVAGWGAGMLATARLDERWTVEGDSVAARVLREGRRRGSAVECPVVVRGRTWGVLAVATYDGPPLPPSTQTRLAQFAELVATAIVNADARAEVRRLADEQAALRRVATLVAEGAAPTAVLDAVAAEMERLLDADQVALCRYEPGAEITVVAHRGPSVELAPPGTRVRHEGESVTALVRQTRRPARAEHFGEARGAIAEIVHATGVRVTVGAPIVVDGRLWGAVTASWTRDEPPPPDTEERMAKFAELLDTAIANADSRDQLMASRARLVTAADEARRRVVRDLHDGAQQRLVHTIVTLKLAQRALHDGSEESTSLVDEALEQAETGNAELRELAHGILPSALTLGGLRRALDTVVERLELPVDMDVTAERFAPEIEASAYFIVAESLTNVVKHAHARSAEVRVSARDGMLVLEVRDDGCGGADPGGHGLVGIADRVTALGGRLRIESPAGRGTVVAATLPLPAG